MEETRLGSQVHILLETFERLAVGLRARRGVDRRTADRVALHIALCLSDWPWAEAERFANKMFPREEERK